MPRATSDLRSALRHGVVATGRAFRRAAPDELAETDGGKRCGPGRPWALPSALRHGVVATRRDFRRAAPDGLTGREREALEP